MILQTVKLQKYLSHGFLGFRLHSVLSALGMIFVVNMFYWPFTAKFFMGDDWLWLGYAIQTMSDPALLLERPIYGYFRPAAMVQLIAFLKIAGASPLFLGTLNATLHSVNVLLLYCVLITYGADRGWARLASILFAFYYLNVPAVAWISAAGDLWVTALTLGCLLAVHRYVLHPNIATCLPVIALGIAAVLMKESGLAVFALYFLAMFIAKQNPFRRPHAVYTFTLMILIGIYLTFYFATITTMDKEMYFGVATLINGWYFLAYTLLPLSERIVASVPEGWRWCLVGAKVLVTLGIPVLFWQAWRRGGQCAKLFIGWTIFYIGTISLFQWDVSLFSLYPERTASRYMYSPDAGMMVLLAWLLRLIWLRWFAGRSGKRIVLTLLTAVFIVVNGAVIYKVTGIYRTRQADQKRMFNNLVSVLSQTDDDRVLILLPPGELPPQLIANPDFVKGMLLVGTGREFEIEMTTRSQLLVLEDKKENRPLFRYDPDSNELTFCDPAIKPE